MQNAGMIYGYARVSTDAQDLTSQRAQLTVAGCEKVSSEKITGTTADRPQLQKLMKALAPGDVVNTRLLIASPAMQPTFSLSPAICSAPGPACVRLQSRLSIRPRILPSLSLPCWASRRSSNAGALERTASGRAAAKAKGVKFGRKPTLTPHRQQVPRQRLAAGETQRSVARSYNVSQATISRLVPSGVWLELKVA